MNDSRVFNEIVGLHTGIPLLLTKNFYLYGIPCDKFTHDKKLHRWEMWLGCYDSNVLYKNLEQESLTAIFGKYLISSFVRV